MSDKLPTGSNKCKCAACGEYFGGVSGFDLHRVGPPNVRNCANPRSLTRKNGARLLTLSEKGYWIRAYKEQGHE